MELFELFIYIFELFAIYFPIMFYMFKRRPYKVIKTDVFYYNNIKVVQLNQYIVTNKKIFGYWVAEDYSSSKKYIEDIVYIKNFKNVYHKGYKIIVSNGGFSNIYSCEINLNGEVKILKDTTLKSLKIAIDHYLKSKNVKPNLLCYGSRSLVQ